MHVQIAMADKNDFLCLNQWNLISISNNNVIFCDSEGIFSSLDRLRIVAFRKRYKLQ